MYLIGVYKTFSNVSKRRVTGSRSPTVYMAYYLSESGSIIKKRIGTFTYFRLKYFARKYKRKTFVCINCSYKFKGIVKNDNQEIECPRCEI